MQKPQAIILASLIAASNFGCGTAQAGTYPATSPEIRYSGRTDFNESSVSIGYPGVEIVIQFTGSEVSLTGEIVGDSSHYNVTLDGDPLPQLDLYSGPFDQTIALGLDPEKIHTLRLVRRSETWIGITRLDTVELAADGDLKTADNQYRRKIVCIGDSITCGEKADLVAGYIEVGPLAWNAEKSYGWEVAKRFNAEPHLVSYGGRGLIRDWQGKTEASTGPQFFERALPDNPNSPWDHDSFSPDLVTICLGTNDFNIGIPEREVFVSTYTAFVKRIHEVHPNAKILLISGPWFGEGDPKKEALNSYILETIDRSQSEGENFVSHHFFDTTYPGTKRDSHPTAPQHRAMAADITKTIGNWLGW